ncbi:MAG: SWIM zinc finger family protein [Sedimentisphaerales bacterium]|nr:SWIM zinc finger family protein [Sedimentisphaerales bacterium]
MPENIEEVFRDAKLTLFPNKSGDLKTDCSCPDWSNPCKHIAAVYYLLGEKFDRDPFLIFKLRGMEQKTLVGLLGGQPVAKIKSSNKRGLSESGFPQKEESILPPEPLPTDPKTFWEQSGADDILGEVSIPPVVAALPKRLGNFPFWRAEQNFLSAMEDIYCKASPGGMDVFLGELTTTKKD